MLAPPAVTVEVSNPVCGDILRLSVSFADRAVQAVRYKVRGCTASIAAGSALTELMAGLDLAALRDKDGKTLRMRLGAVERIETCRTFCVDAVRALIKELKNC